MGSAARPGKRAGGVRGGEKVLGPQIHLPVDVEYFVRAVKTVRMYGCKGFSAVLLVVLLAVLPASAITSARASNSEFTAQSPEEIHRRAWAQAAANCKVSKYHKYAIYSSRSLAVYNPEVYLQADALWMNMVTTYGGWEYDYLDRDRKLNGKTGWWEKVGGKINDGFQRGKHAGSFSWRIFNWNEHRKNAADLFDFYGDSPTLGWLDNRLVFIWNAMKGIGWKMPWTSVAEAKYLQLLSEGKSVYLILTDDRKGYVAEVSREGVVLHDPLTGTTAEKVSGTAVLAMNNEHVWYPLMGRDDRGKDPGLKRIVEKYCEEGKVPQLEKFERSLLADLQEGTRLTDRTDRLWAQLFAIRAVNQNTWRAKPLRELSAELFPKRYRENGRYSDSPYEQICLGMVITEMGNRLSPMVATWAEVVQRNAHDPEKAFAELGGQYLNLFHRDDSDSDWVYGDYYRCWLPNIDDKLISGLGNCFVEANNTMAALSLANLDEWEIFEVNWLQIGSGEGHVICGAYTPYGNFTLSNGLFNRSDGVCLRGPLWNIKGRVVDVIIYNPRRGFVATDQTANFSEFATPFTNMTFEETVAFLELLRVLESEVSIGTGHPVRANTTQVNTLSKRRSHWQTNMLPWLWTDSSPKS